MRSWNVNSLFVAGSAAAAAARDSSVRERGKIRLLKWFVCKNKGAEGM